MRYLSIILWAFLLLNITWIYFTAIMRLQEVRDKGLLTGKVLRAFAYPNLYIGLVLDTMVNVLIMTPLFLELPREFLTTARLCRWYETAPLSWRGRLAEWFGSTLLNPIDPSGRHVK